MPDPAPPPCPRCGYLLPDCACVAGWLAHERECEAAALALLRERKRKRQVPSPDLLCSVCGVRCPAWECYERRGALFCGRCLLATPERRAYEHWFVRG